MKKQKQVLFNGKDLNTITDFDTLDKLKKDIEPKFENIKDCILYLSPKTESEQKFFEKRFMEEGKPKKQLQNNSFLTQLFANYKTMELAIYMYRGEDFQGQVIYRHSLISFIKGEVNTGKILGI